MKLRHCLFFQCPILHKTLITGGVRVVSGGVSMVSGMWNEEIFGHTNTKSIGKISISSDIAFLPVPSIAYKYLCLGVSGWCLRVSG